MAKIDEKRLSFLATNGFKVKMHKVCEELDNRDVIAAMAALKSAERMPGRKYVGRHDLSYHAIDGHDRRKRGRLHFRLRKRRRSFASDIYNAKVSLQLMVFEDFYVEWVDTQFIYQKDWFEIGVPIVKSWKHV